MDFNESKITLAAQFTKQCLLPELDRDIGDQPLEREDFSMYVYGLEQNLRLLFDIIAKNTDALFARTAETEEFRLNFVLLLNEQTGGRNAPFQTLDKSLINQLQSLIRQYYSDVLRDRCIVYGVLDYYKSKVTDRNWKKCIGAVHGYERFCEIYYGQKKAKLAGNDGLFLLSVATILTEYFEDPYKNMGVDLFHILLTSGDKKHLTESNIYEAIFTKIMNPLILTIKNEQTLNVLVKCLLECVANDKKWRENASEWNKADDVLEELLKRIAVEPNSSLVLIGFVAKLIALSISDNEEVKISLDFDALERNLKAGKSTDDIAKLRELCAVFQNEMAFRWTKKLLELLAHQPYYGQTAADIVFALRVWHVTYLITIYPTELKLLDPIWITFIEGSLPVLIGVVKANKTNANIMKEISEIIATYLSHIDRSQHNLGASEDIVKEIKESLIEVREEINLTDHSADTI